VSTKRELKHQPRDNAVLLYISELGRTQQTAAQVSDELARLGRHGADWPRASRAEWIAEIGRLIDAGSLEQRPDDTLRIPRENSSKPTQMGLF
jgi:phosphohistidine phosphatase SixA